MKCVRKSRTWHPKRCGLSRCGYMGIMFNQGWKVKNKQPMGDYNYVAKIEGGRFIILAFFVYVLLFGQRELLSYNFHLTIQRWSSPPSCPLVVYGGPNDNPTNCIGSIFHITWLLCRSKVQFFDNGSYLYYH